MNRLPDPTQWPSYTIHKITPEGEMYVTIAEDPLTGTPKKIFIIIGKSGSALAAWAEAVSILCTRLLELNFNINTLAMDLSNIVTDKVAWDRNAKIKGGIEGVVWGINYYIKHKQSMEYKVIERVGMVWDKDGERV